MGRELVSREEIIGLVNERAQELGAVAPYTLTRVLRLQAPESDGCNWTAGSLRGLYTSEFRQALREIRARYNLEDDA
jgi:hypothetical protein